MRVIFFIVCVALSSVATYFGYPLVRENPDAVIVMATVLTVFAGFLVAIIAILGDPAMIPGNSWREAEMRRPSIEAMVIKQVWLFYLYLLAIGLLFAGVLLHKEPDAAVAVWIKSLVDIVYLFFAVLSFLLTLALPSTLGKIQLARNLAEIEARRAAAGIRQDSGH
ncbi:MAG TPA: hypothetical protein VND19_16320 [Acetobacteraceae bacterium]|nr:hypothetical protein [Acetobacteraceae bacterium]